jgi:hypothetical protein
VDEVVSKIASKQVVPATATGKAIHVEEEVDDDLDTTISSKASKGGQKISKEIKKSK